MSVQPDNKSIVLFDGICNFCNSSVNKIIKNDQQDRFRFAAIQSETGQKLMKKFGIDPAETDSVILIENNQAFIKSTAILRISKHLGGLYPLASALLVFPPFLRNAVYDFIARSRYKWFGKKDSCMIPGEEVKAKFLE